MNLGLGSSGSRDKESSQDPELPKPKFIREVLLKCLRLSYHQRVTDIVPDSFAAFAKFHPVFKSLADTEETQICVLRSVWDLWRNHHQMLVVLTDKLLKTGVVECAAVANWVFSKDMVQAEFSKCYIWEIINITIRKMNKHVTKLSKEASEARKMIEDSDSDSSDSDNEDGNKRRGKNKPTEKPSEEAVEKLEERLEAAQADQKNLFLIIFQRFIMILSEHLVRCDTDAVDFKNPWYNWTVGRLHQIFMLHHEQVERYSSTLETLLFTQDLDPNILDVFHQFVALRM